MNDVSLTFAKSFVFNFEYYNKICETEKDSNKSQLELAMVKRQDYFFTETNYPVIFSVINDL